MDEERRLDIVVPDDIEEPSRVDQFLTSELADQFDKLSRSRIQKLIDDGKVSIDDKPAKAGLKLKVENGWRSPFPLTCR
jgi:23S rRNA-/tRNA-specific pseudouridylate synthase